MFCFLAEKEIIEAGERELEERPPNYFCGAKKTDRKITNYFEEFYTPSGNSKK